jgi:hypothetical protein
VAIESQRQEQTNRHGSIFSPISTPNDHIAHPPVSTSCWRCAKKVLLNQCLARYGSDVAHSIIDPAPASATGPVFGSSVGQSCRETHDHGQRRSNRDDKFTRTFLFASCLQLLYQSGQVEIDFLTDQQIAVEIEICD